jgi:hypothetical protein
VWFLLLCKDKLFQEGEVKRCTKLNKIRNQINALGAAQSVEKQGLAENTNYFNL